MLPHKYSVSKGGATISGVVESSVADHGVFETGFSESCVPERNGVSESCAPESVVARSGVSDISMAVRYMSERVQLLDLRMFLLNFMKLLKTGAETILVLPLSKHKILSFYEINKNTNENTFFVFDGKGART